MPLRNRIQDIKSFMPSADAKSADEVYVLDGRNYLFDSKGPRSGYSTEILTPFGITAPRDIQGISIEGRTLVFTQDGILAWRNKVPFTWEVLYNFDFPLPSIQRTPWQCIFFANKLYVAQEGRGFFSSDVQVNTLKLTLIPETELTIPGLLQNVKGLDIVRGRAIVINDSTIQWSAVGDFSDLTPALGGAGIQFISNFAKGHFLALSAFQDAFVVWTTEGAILASYIGGDSVWRFDPYPSTELPLDSWCTTVLSNGNVVILTHHGLQLISNGGIPQDWTPDFNEFLRDYMKDQVKGSAKWRIEYDSRRQMIFVSESTDGVKYWRTLVLHPTLNKWGIMSDPVYGMLPLTEDYYGYVDAIESLPRYFKQAYSRGDSPDNSLGLNRFFPRVQKQLAVPSSSAVCNAISPDLSIDQEVPVVPVAGWYLAESFYPQPYGRKGMDSWVDIGYIRTTERYSPVGAAFNTAADTLLEIQEVIVGSIPTGAPTPSDFTTDWKADFFYGDTPEDWNSTPTITSHDQVIDFMTANVATSVDYLTALNGHNLDHLYADFPIITYSDDGDEDWNVISGAEDWGGPISGLSILDYTFTIESAQDEITVATFVPELARFNTTSRMFTTMTTGNLHTLHFGADGFGEYYHIKNLEVTFSTGGRLA